MLIETTNNTYIAGPLDVLCILHDVNTDRYHVAFFEEKPFPGQGDILSSEVETIRLKSKMHHTEGADTLEGALKHLEEMLKTISVKKRNIWIVPKEWDGHPAITWVLSKWW